MTKELLASYTRRDFDIQTMAAGGPGGQHQNKTQSAVRIVHLPTGLSAECREHRSQHQNKKEAFRKLAERIRTYWKLKLFKEKVRSLEVIRTYNQPDNRVKDHESGHTDLFTSVVEDISEMIEVRATAIAEKQSHLPQE